MRWLPVPAWQVFAAKFLPGLAAAILLPLLMHTIALHQVPADATLQIHFRVIDEAHPHTIHFVHVLAAHFVLVLNLIYSLTGYILAFTIGMLASSSVAVIATVMTSLGIYIFVQGLYPGNQGSFFAGSLLETLVTCVGITVLIVMTAQWGFARNRSMGAKRVQSAIVGLIALASVLWIGKVPLVSVDQSPKSDVVLLQGSPSGDVCVGKDVVAYRVALWPGYPDEVRVQTRSADRLVVRAAQAKPLSWFPNGDLLVETSGRVQGIEILKWDRNTGHTVLLIRLPTHAHGHYAAPSAVALGGDGTKIAYTLSPYGGSGLDLWVADTITHRAKILGAGIADGPLAWRGDVIVFSRNWQEYWSIRPDGTDLSPIMQYQEGE
jgi:hypothetical protein